MYRNQYEYDNAEPQGQSLREIAEERVAELLDKRDPEMVEKMVEHAALELTVEADTILEALSVISASKFQAIINAVMKIDPDTAHGIYKLGQYADKARAEFITEKAEEMLKEAAE